MSIQRYDSVGWEEMDESRTGEFVKLQDIIKLLENTYAEMIDELGIALAKDELDLLLDLIDLIKGEK